MRHVNNIPGLFIQENVATSEIEKRIIEWLDTKTWSNALSRRTQHYGYIYNYKQTNLEPGEKFDGWIYTLSQFLIDNKIMDRCDQCIVNEYGKTHGIAKHIDGLRGNKPNIFGPVIVSLSLGEDTNIIFRDTKSRDTANIYVPKGSLLVMTGDSRYTWTHEIPKLSTINRNGESIKKSENYRRISLTFRSIVQK